MSAITVASCSRCQNAAVIFQRYSGIHLCHRHLEDSIRKRVSKAMRAQLKLPKNARREDGSPQVILVCISGGKDSAVLLDMMVKIIGPRRDIELVAGSVDEGIDGYRAPSMEKAFELAESYGVRVETISYPELDFTTMDSIVELMPSLAANSKDADGMKACSYCGVFRRQGLNELAKRVGANWMALGHNLDDTAQTILMNLQKGEVDRTIRLAPHTWAPIDGLVPRIVPLRWVPEQEIHAYAQGAGLPIFHGDCPHAPGALRQRSRDMIARLEEDVPGSRHGLVHSMDAIRELQVEAKGTHLSTEWASDRMHNCEKCGEATSQPLCQACIMRNWLSEITNDSSQ
ncbi:MAG: adenine nucleotide alpha hydrolase family protein [Euryarchaeota archaeon]|jgi:uncharacterized protein (TIGR00269 family)|nr:adenine nucleotide alpha hydrolase family protein [Euryarchaeota archaeon]